MAITAQHATTDSTILRMCYLLAPLSLPGLRRVECSCEGEEARGRKRSRAPDGNSQPPEVPPPSLEPDPEPEPDCPLSAESPLEPDGTPESEAEDAADPSRELDPESEPWRESEPSTPESRGCESEIICVAPS